MPDLTRSGELCAPNAQHAVRKARTLADTIVADLRGRPATPYRHAYAGSAAGPGLHKGVAYVYGVKMRGLLAWFLHRTYHLSRVPTLNRKVGVVAYWTLALFFRRETVSLGNCTGRGRSSRRRPVRRLCATPLLVPTARPGPEPVFDVGQADPGTGRPN